VNNHLRAGIVLRELGGRFEDPIKIQTQIWCWMKSAVAKEISVVFGANTDNEYARMNSTIVQPHRTSADAPKKPTKTWRYGAVKVDLQESPLQM